jgi:hypothetical protein
VLGAWLLELSCRLALPSPLLPQPAQSPKVNAKENQPAAVHADRITEFVRAAGVLRRVNADVLADEQSGQRGGHKRAMNHSAAETRRAVRVVGNGENPAEYGAKDRRKKNQPEDPPKDSPRQTGILCDFRLSI